MVIWHGSVSQDFLNIQGYGLVELPKVGTNTNAPIIQSVSGNAVTLASNSTFAGFIIDSPSGHGIFADGVHDALVSNVRIDNAGGDAIFLQNGSGGFSFRGITINGPAGTGLHIAGGSADITFSGQIDTGSSRSLLITDTTDGLINLSGTSVVGGGVQLLDNDGDVVLDSLEVNDASGIGVEIRRGSGNVTVLNATTITNAADTGLLVDDREGDTVFNSATIVASDGEKGIEVTDNDGETWFNSVDVESTNGTAVFARDTERFTIAGGVVNAEGGAAFDLEDTKVNMLLSRVSASDGAFGIRIVGGDGVFAIAGTTAFGSGGAITNADVGVLLEDFKTVGIASLDLTENVVGLQATNVDQLALTSVRVLDSTSYALKMLDVGEFHSINSQYLRNGSLDASIVYEVDEAGAHVFSMTQSTVEALVGDAVRIEALSGSTDATLNVALQGNAIATEADFATAVLLNWNGLLLANALSNGIQANGDASTAFNMTIGGPSLAQVSIGNNLIAMDGEGSTAIRVSTAGPSEVVLGGNQIALQQSNSFGVDFTLAESADVAILRNTIVDLAGGGTGVYFRQIEGPSAVEISENLLDFRGPSALIDRGIIFQNVTEDDITLSGSQNNLIQNATTPFFAPSGTIDGKILINGQSFPK